MAVRSGPFSAGWISTRLKKIDVAPRKVVVLMDTTYWVRGFGLMFFKDAHTRENLQWYYVKTETNRLYAKGVNELRPKGFNVMAICDGKKGLIGTFRDIPVQLCQFHQVATIRRYVTKNPKMPVSIDLKAHVAMLKTRTGNRSRMDCRFASSSGKAF